MAHAVACRTFGLVPILLLLVHRAHAQPATVGQNADQLFQEGRQLMQHVQPEEIERGCAKLAASQALDPAAGTLLNLGECYEKLGRVWSAFSAYKQAWEAAREKKRFDWSSFAEARLKVLEPRLSRVRILGTKPPTAHLEMDGRLVDVENGMTVRVDPGAHRIVLVDGDRELFSRSIQLVEGATVDVTLDERQQEKKVTPPPPTPQPPPAPSNAPGGGGILPGVWVLGGLGVASLAFGATMLGIREGQVSSMVNECGADGTVRRADCSAEKADSLASNASRSMAISIVGFGVGAALVASAILVQATSTSDVKEARLRCAPGLLSATCAVRF